jgi:hypothetical protein
MRGGAQAIDDGQPVYQADFGADQDGAQVHRRGLAKAWMLRGWRCPWRL